MGCRQSTTMQGRSFFSTACASLAGSAATYSQARKAAITAAAAALERMTALHTTVRIATFHRAAPTRCGAFAAERRIVAGDEGGCVSGTPSASVPVLTAPGGTDVGRWRALRFPRLVRERRMLASLHRAHRHPVATRPRLAAHRRRRRRMRHRRAARPWSRRSPRAFATSHGRTPQLSAATRYRMRGRRTAHDRHRSAAEALRPPFRPSPQHLRLP